MKSPLAAALLLFCVIFFAPGVSAQQGGGSGTNQHRISAMSHPSQTSQPAPTSSKPALFWCMYTLNAGTAHAFHYVNDTLIHADSASYPRISDAWIAYIRKTYSISPSQERANNTTGCNDMTTDSPRGPQWFVDHTEALWKASGHTVTHLNWTYTPPPPGTAAQSAATASYIYCASDVGTSPVYFSDIFAVDVPQDTHSFHSPSQAVFDKITADFLAFIRKKYSYRTNSSYPAGCPNYGAGAAALKSAQDTKKKLQDQARASSLQVVETGWNYNSPPSSAPVAGAAPAPAAASAPAPAASSSSSSLTGAWRMVLMSHTTPTTLTLQQNGNSLTGTLGTTPIEAGTLEGSRIHFVVPDFQGVPHDYTGKVDSPGSLSGNETAPQENIPWRATRPVPASAAGPASAPTSAAAPAPHPAPANAAPAAAAAPVAAPAPAPAVAAPAGKAFRCAFTVHEGTQSMRYVAGPIVTEATQVALSEAWRNYITATYHPSHPQGQGGCTILPGKPANWDKVVSSFEENSNRLGVKTTHVNWTSAPKH